MSKITLTNLKKYLSQRTQAELIADITDLFSRLDTVKEYYQLRIVEGTESERAVVEKYRAIIQKEFFPSRGMGDPRLSVARKAISDYKKVSTSPEGLADLMLFYVEMGVRFTNSYGDIDEPFYNSMESMYERALEHIKKHQLEELFEDRAKAIVHNTRGIGWGFHDGLSDTYARFFFETTGRR